MSEPLLTSLDEASDEAPKPIKYEDIELWTFLFKNGAGSVTYAIRVESNEKAMMVSNPIDQTLVEIRLILRTEDEKNETSAVLGFPIINLQCYTMEKQKRPVYAKGDDPVSREVRLRADKRAQRSAALERQAKLREEEFERELAAAEKGEPH